MKTYFVTINGRRYRVKAASWPVAVNRAGQALARDEPKSRRWNASIFVEEEVVE